MFVISNWVGKIQTFFHTKFSDNSAPHLYLQVVTSSVRLLMLSGPPPNLPSTQGSPAVLVWLGEILVLLPHCSQKQWSRLTGEMYHSTSLVVIAGKVRGWRPRDVYAFMGRGNQKVWVPAGLDLHMSTMEVSVHLTFPMSELCTLRMFYGFNKILSFSGKRGLTCSIKWIKAKWASAPRAIHTCRHTIH